MYHSEVSGKPKYIKLDMQLGFYDLFKKIESKNEYCHIFESLGEDSTRNRYHVIGFSPRSIISSVKIDELIIEDLQHNCIHKIECENAYEELRKLIPQNILSREYAGGLVGFCAYDCINYFDSSVCVKKHTDFETFKFALYLDGLILDNVTNSIEYFYYNENRISIINDLIQQEIPIEKSLDISFIKDTLSEKEHKLLMNKVKENIKLGNLFQCELGYQSKYTVQGDKRKIYDELRQINPSPHMFYVKFKEQCIIGASPELLVRLKDNEVESYPLAGTIKRGKSEVEDKDLAKKLLQDQKEIAEHNMLVDLHRNDIGKVSIFGTVRIRKLMDIKKFSHVQHISSEISGLLSPKYDMFSCLRANFPAGTLTGAPKIEAMNLIDEMEIEARGIYGGAVGEFCFNGNCNFAIPIRSIFINKNEAYIQTCGGIVYDSEASKEYNEIQKKLAASKIVLDKFNGDLK
ncbi:anthranilate synthase component I family protein [Paraphotobacterium marinum]|nr:chorismate-binding protein [Paraphotobacterium marinum]